MKLKLNVKRKNRPAKLNKKTSIKKNDSKRLVFNFSFLTPDKKYNLSSNSKTINDKVRRKLLEKIVLLSQDPKPVIMALKKESGLEEIPEKQIKFFRKHPDFVNSNRNNECGESCWVFRLNKLGRVIGKMHDNIFYIIKIDTDFKSYDH